MKKEISKMPDVESILGDLNGTSRVRTLTLNEVWQVVHEAYEDGFGYTTAGRVSYAYKYRALTRGAVCVRIRGRFYLSLQRFSAYASSVTWFGAKQETEASLEKWYRELTVGSLGKTWVRLSDSLVDQIVRERRAKEEVKLKESITSIPNVVISYHDSLKAGNCMTLSKRVARRFKFKPTPAREVARAFPALAPYVKRTATRVVERFHNKGENE